MVDVKPMKMPSDKASDSYKVNPFPSNYPKIYNFTLAWIFSHIPAQSKVLDIGCGNGFLAERIVTTCNPVKVVGLDIDPVVIRQAQSVTTSSTQLQILEGNAENYDLLHNLGQFDVVITRNSFHHFEAKEEFLRVVRDDVLAPGGVFLLMDLDERSNFGIHGLGAYVTLFRACFTGNALTVLQIVFQTRFLRDESMRNHREHDKRRLQTQGWYSEKSIREKLALFLPGVEYTRLGTLLRWGGCYAALYTRSFQHGKLVSHGNEALHE